MSKVKQYAVKDLVSDTTELAKQRVLLKKAEVAVVLDIAFDCIFAALQVGQKPILPRLGKLVVRRRGARTIRNKFCPEGRTAKAHNTVAFLPGSELKKALND